MPQQLGQQIRLRVNLASAIFPFYTEAAGRTIIRPEDDENYDRYNAANTTPDKGVPQVLYMHNVMPVAGGFQSIAYTAQLAAYGSVTNSFDQIFTLQAPDLSKVLFSPAQGANYIYDGQLQAWNSVNPITSAGINANTLVTIAFINSQTYFNYQNYGTYFYNTATQSIQAVTLESLETSVLGQNTVKGITAANGYMIAWNDTAIAWSSLVNPLDFTPSIQTGAGGGQIQQAKGKLMFCLPVSGGFLAYCEGNVVAATYTNNTNYPFVFTEVAGSGGCLDPNLVGWQSNLPFHFAYTTSGLQQINLNNAQPVLPEVTDFLANEQYEDFNESTLTFTQTDLGAQVAVRLACVSDRFVVISYGQNNSVYTYAIVYDLTLNRYGKLKTSHIACFPYPYPNPYLGVTYAAQLTAGTSYSTLLAAGTTYSQELTTEVAIAQKTTLAFITTGGAVNIVNFDITEDNADGVFIIGKYQVERNAYITHQTTDVEDLTPSYNPKCYLLPTLDGKTFLPAVSTVAINNNTNQRNMTFAARYTALNISIMMVGAFDLTTMVVSFTEAGFR